MHSSVPLTALHDAADWLLRDRSTDRWRVAQPPNLPAVVWGVAVLAARLPTADGANAEAARAVATGASVVWATGEVVAGVNPFRRLLGLAVLVWRLTALVPVSPAPSGAEEVGAGGEASHRV